MFLLIGHSNRVRRSEAISIHLMFLLISGQRMHYRIKSNYFNTSHVSINRSHRNAAVLPLSISIHLMFLLIAYQRAIEIAKCNFNTSHVSINPAKLGRKATGDSDFNTSHVSINLCQGSKNGHGDEFQYISCFY